jgi:leader peptidase (prepilin peptidase)/N-methyltransferase
MKIASLPAAGPAWTIAADSETRTLAALVAGYALVWTAALAAMPETALPRLLLTGMLGIALVTLSAIDLRSLRLPDRLTLPLLGAGLLGALVQAGPVSAAHHVGAAALGFGGLVLIEHLYRHLRGRDGLGRGDAKLFAAAGAWVGIEAMAPVLLIASLGTLAAIGIASLMGRRPAASARLPFGPALAGATWLVWLASPFA